MILFLLACDTGAVDLVDATYDTGPVAEAPGGGGGGDDDDDDDDDDDEDEDDERWDCSDLFNQSRLPVYEIEIDEGDWHYLEQQWKTSDGTKDYVPIQELRVDGEEVPDAMMRLKGNSSCCWYGDKMQFVVAFNEVNEDARFHGLRKVAFDSPFYEPTVLKNRLANWFLHEVGLPGACTNNALMYVNDEYYGIYAHMEELDREFLERHFGDENADGDLWKYGYVLDNHEDEEVDTSRIEEFWSSYAPADTAPMGEPSEWLSEWAAEAVLPDGDGYWCCGHNYYLYDHPERGFLWIPWDKDGTFDWVSYDSDPFYLWYPDYTPHMAYMLAEPEYYQAFAEEMMRQVGFYGSEEMMAALAEMQEQTYEWGLADPYRYYDDTYYEYYMDNLPIYVEARRGFLDYAVPRELESL